VAGRLHARPCHTFVVLYYFHRVQRYVHDNIRCRLMKHVGGSEKSRLLLNTVIIDGVWRSGLRGVQR